MRSTHNKKEVESEPNNTKKSNNSTYHIIQRFPNLEKETLPLKHRPYYKFKEISENLSKSAGSFHDLYKVIKQRNEKEKNNLSEEKKASFYFRKQRKEHPYDPYMYQLEAAANEVCHFFAPYHTSTSHVTHDNCHRDNGIVSKNFVGFKPAFVDPLKEEDLEIPGLGIVFGYDLLLMSKKEFDEKGKKSKHPVLIMMEDKSFKLWGDIDGKGNWQETALNQFKLAKDWEKKESVFVCSTDEIYPILKKGHTLVLDAPNSPIKRLKTPALSDYVIQEMEKIDKRAEEENYNLDMMPSDQLIFTIIEPSNNNLVKNKFRITVRDLKNYRIAKGNGIGLTMNYMLGNDDCHTSNISKDGKMIDFDMWLWEVYYKFKQLGMFDYSFRNPDSNFKITTHDVENFPDIKDANFFYWCTFPVRMIPERFRAIVSLFFNVSRNAFKGEDNEVYKQFVSHPVFNYHKFATLLKFCLAGKEVFTNLLSMHIRNDLTAANKSVINLVANYIEERKLKLLSALYQSKLFKEFLEVHGDSALKQIILEVAEHNHKYINKSKKQEIYKNQVVDLSQFVNNYAKISATPPIKLFKNQDVLKSSEEIENAIKENEEFFAMKKSSLRITK